MEVSEPMEESSAVTTAFPTKRKAESDPADEIEESGDEIQEIDDDDEIEESGVSYVDYMDEWIAPEWDVDSFDGLEFDESEEKRLCIFDDDVDVDVDKWLRFRRQHIENKGFLVEPELWPMYKYSEHTVIADLEESAGKGQTYRTYFQEMACLCLERYNEDQKKVKENFIDVEFVEVVGGVVKLPKSFITFKAKEKPDGPLVEYQAKVWCDIVEPGVFEDNPILCRPAPPKPSN